MRRTDTFASRGWQWFVPAVLMVTIIGCTSSPQVPSGAAPAASPAAASTAVPAPAKQPVPASTTSGARPTSKADIANYQGADREQFLLEGARQEGKVMWYTSLIVDQVVQPLKEAFEAKYPGVKVEFFRGNNADILQRALNEYRTGRHDVDVFEIPLPGYVTLREAKVLQPFWFPDLALYDKGLVDPERYWAADRVVYYTLTWNTNLIKPTEVPNVYEDLVRPELKGKLGTNSIYTGGPQWIGGILETMGEQKGRQFIDQLANQDVKVFNMTPAALMDLIVSGEVPMSPTTFNHHAEIRIAKGAPLAWKTLNPAFGYAGGMAVAGDPPHPHAAMLFNDFILGEQGQRELVKLSYIPTHPKVEADPPTLRVEPAWYYDPAVEAKNEDKWLELFRQKFVSTRR
jgi:iron(III) transport system substrate-binding protein